MSSPSPSPTRGGDPQQIAIADECEEHAEPLLEALQELDSRLNVGLNFEDYSERVGDIRVAYDQTDFDAMSELDFAYCLLAIGVPAENALNRYVEANNIWNDCIQDLGCSNDEIEGQLQAKWERATNNIERALNAIELLHEREVLRAC